VGISAIQPQIKVILHIFNAQAQTYLISTSGLKSNVTMFDRNFLYDAGIPEIREHLRQKLAYLCVTVALCQCYAIETNLVFHQLTCPKYNGEKNRSTGTVHTSAKARLTSVTIWILIVTNI